MTVSQTPRFLLKKYSSGGDPHPNRTEFNAMIDIVENNGGMYSQGVTGSRPAAGKRGRWYWDETVSRMYYDNGTAWQDQNPNGGGGAGSTIVPATAGTEGTSARSARADHTHALPLATTVSPGAMSAAHKAKLDGAAVNPTASALVVRDSSGLFVVGTPTGGGHPTTKTYVDGQITTLGDQAADYADAAILAAPIATPTTAGQMSAADKAKLNAATASSTVSTVVQRSSAGVSAFSSVILDAAPVNSFHSTRKDYVDAQVTGAKTFATDAIAAAPNATGSVAGKMSAADKTKLDAATGNNVDGTIVQRGTGGRINIGDPVDPVNGATKGYVDTQVAGAKTYADDGAAPLPRGLIGLVQDATLSASRNNTDASLGEVTINAVAGRTYMITVALDWYAETVGDMGLTINFRRGGTTGPTGTLIRARVVWGAPVSISSAASEVSVVYKATTTGALRLSASSARIAGSGGYRITNNEIRISDEGAVA